MRRIIAALQISLDGYIEGPNGEIDWIESWADPFDLPPDVDMLLLGGGMYPGYESYWSAVLAAPDSPLPFSGKPATQGERDYAAFAERTSHVVLSTTLQDAGWSQTRLVRTLDAVADLKYQPGGSIHAVGGASLVGSLIDHDLVDELRLVVHPVLLGEGKPLFRHVDARRELLLTDVRSLEGGLVRMTHQIQPVMRR